MTERLVSAIENKDTERPAELVDDLRDNLQVTCLSRLSLTGENELAQVGTGVLAQQKINTI